MYCLELLIRNLKTFDVLLSTFYCLQVMDLMKKGENLRKIGVTNMNERSSRSHSIFRVVSTHFDSLTNIIEIGSQHIFWCICVSVVITIVTTFVSWF